MNPTTTHATYDRNLARRIFEHDEKIKKAKIYKAKNKRQLHPAFKK